MTEFELHTLMLEQSVLFNSYLEFWLLYTSTLVVIGFFAGTKLDIGLRRLILFLYLIAVVVSVFSWLDSVVGYSDYYNRLLEQGGTPIKHLPAVGYLPVLMSLTYLVGTLGAVVYFLRASRHTGSKEYSGS